MPRERDFNVIILKKQPLNEADELITVFSQEAGKLRFLAKAVKSAKSKLQHALQSAFLARVRVTDGRLPKVISAQVVETFSGLRKNLSAMKLTLYALELALRFTADEHKNQKLFLALLDFFNFLSRTPKGEALSSGLAKFKIIFAEALGFKIRADRELLKEKSLYFSDSKGGFTAFKAADAWPASPEVLTCFFAVSEADFAGLKLLGKQPDLSKLQGFLSGFLEYHLEDRVNAESLLDLRGMV